MGAGAVWYSASWSSMRTRMPLPACGVIKALTICCGQSSSRPGSIEVCYSRSDAPLFPIQWTVCNAFPFLIDWTVWRAFLFQLIGLGRSDPLKSNGKDFETMDGYVVQSGDGSLENSINWGQVPEVWVYVSNFSPSLT